MITDYFTAGQQGRPVGAEAAQIVGGRQDGLLQVAGGLGGGQRQVTELGDQLVGQLLAQRRFAAGDDRVTYRRMPPDPAEQPLGQ